MKKPYLLLLTSSTLLACIQPTLAHADDGFDTYDRNLLEVPIRDQRGSKASSTAISSTTLLTRDDIQASGALTIDQVLQQVSGLQWSRNGGPGSVTSFYVRGAEADTTLVLLNDVRIQSINTGFSLISDLPLEAIERIEIIRGAQSALYGSAAPGGIIKIYTTPQNQRRQFSFTNKNSTDGDNKSSLAGAGNLGDFLVFGSTQWTTTDGIDACNLNSACFVAEPEQDLDGNETLNGQVGFQFYSDRGHSIQVSQLYNNARQEFDGDFLNESESTQKVTHFQWNQPVTKQHNLRFDAGQFNELFINFPNPNNEFATESRYGTDRYTASLVHEFGFKPTETTGLNFISGVDYDDATIVKATHFPKINRESTAVFSELEYQKNNASVRFGARRDRYQETQPVLASSKENYATTGHIKLSLGLVDHWTLKSGIGRNFNMPTFSELYFPGFGNPELGPETHVSREIGIEYKHDGLQSSLFYYQTQSKDLIIFSDSSLRSLGEARIEGIEFSNEYKKDQLNIGSNITWMDATDQTATGQRGNKLPRRAALQFAGHVSYQVNQTIARFGTFSSSKRFDNLANTREVAGYTIFELGLQHQATDALTLGIRVDNLFDKQYETVLGYNQPDRSLWLEVNYTVR